MTRAFRLFYIYAYYIIHKSVIYGANITALSNVVILITSPSPFCGLLFFHSPCEEFSHFTTHVHLLICLSVFPAILLKARFAGNTDKQISK